MKIVVSGSSGLVGSALVPALTSAGHEVQRLVRERKRATLGDIFWEPASGELHPRDLEPFDAVVHLAGENIAARRWSAEQKQKMLRSRVDSTRSLANALAKDAGRPRTLVCASAIGYYGDRGDEVLDESSAPGTGFLADVCREWEAATRPAVEAGLRVVNTRFGVILSHKGGALKKMLLPFRLGLGGKVGGGRQYMSWIALDDVVWSLVHCLERESLSGPVNVVAPNPVTNAEFTKTLGKVLSRPTVFSMPAPFARTAFGQMADELLLASQRVRPGRLEESGYSFGFPMLEAALRHILGPKIA